MSKTDDEANLVWNRAAMKHRGPAPRVGDESLSAVLLVHGLVMNGGVFHAVGSVTAEELRANCARYRFFGFE